MAYTAKQIIKLAEEVIKEDKEIVFIDDLTLAMGICTTTFYKHIPAGTEEMDYIKSLIQVNKAEQKRKLRSKWYQSDNATLSLCAYKLLSNEEERGLLADKKDVKHEGGFSLFYSGVEEKAKKLEDGT
jgi:ribosomal protein S24E